MGYPKHLYFKMDLRIKNAILLLLAIMPAVAAGLETVLLQPSQDNTLYETEADTSAEVFERSNGKGLYLFTGRVDVDGNRKQRRALLKFDLIAHIPPDAQISYAALTLHLSKVPLTAQFPLSVKLHRMLAPWGEGSSNAPDNLEGQGAAAEQNDATWHHSFYGPDNPALWQDNASMLQPGGYFDAIAVASTVIGFDFGPYTWECTPELISKVQDWLDNPTANHGWMLLVSENPPSNGGPARRFNSREFTDEKQRPVLEIHYSSADTVLESGFEQTLCP